ncbi:hypothetical protein PBRA_002280 [Plasmodiophora brassicae]|uniref:Uncharacterized protein n=1 Tax=Plasmodiophora brassicae TaxID=37360 RepID=A0A0G4J362_PLABS|nr:hypothetical protein PBRA_002280 [Plasmodiophora brassicae]
MFEDRAADTVDVELLLLLHIRGDPYLRVHRCTIISSPSILVRVDGATNGEPVTGMAVVTGEPVASVCQVVLDVSTSPAAFPLGPLITISPNNAVSIRVAATNPLVCVHYDDRVRLFGQNLAFVRQRRIRDVPVVIAYGTTLRVTYGTHRFSLGLYRPRREIRQARMDRWTRRLLQHWSRAYGVENHADRGFFIDAVMNFLGL